MPTLILTISAILTIAGFFSQYGWLFDLASHFRVQYAVLQLLCIFYCIFLKKKKVLALISPFLILNIFQIVPLYFPVHATPHSEPVEKLKILFMNVHSQNSEYEKVIQYIKKTDPDILALEEINDRWLGQLSGVLESFPYKKYILRDDNFGIGLFSKLPSINMDIQYYSEIEVPSILASFSVKDKPVDILFTHPVPPGSPEYFHWRNEQLSTIAALRSRFNDSLIVIGDLNTTSWSYYFKNFTKKMKLLDSRQRYGIQTTWPAMLPIMGITIDHCLISPNMSVSNREIGPDVGSDHYPVFIEVGLSKF